VVSVAVQSVVYVILSHVLARTPYQLSCDQPMLRQALSFGLPLTLNGVGLAIMSQLDRVLVGYWFGVKGLAVYAVIFSMSVVPTYLIVSVFSSPSLSFPPVWRSGRFRSLRTLPPATGILHDSDQPLCRLDGANSRPIDTANIRPFICHQPVCTCPLVFDRVPQAPTLGCAYNAPSRERSNQATCALNLSSGLGLLIAFACIVVWPRLESMLIGIAHW